MAQSLITLVMQQLAPTVVDKLAGFLGQSQGTTEKALSGSIPAMLAGLLGLASKPEGADRLASAVQRQDPGVLNNLSTMFGSGAQQASEQGRSAMTSLLGGQTLDGLTSAIGRFAGINQGSAASLIGLCTPVIMSVLGRQQKSAGLDAGGLSRMLAGEKDAIAGAMPPGLGQLLGGTNILDSVRDKLGTAATAGAKPFGATPASEDEHISQPYSSSAAKPATYTAKPTAPSRSSLPSWLLGLAAAVVLALIAYWLWGNQGAREVAQQATDRGTAGTSLPPAPSVMVGNVDIGRQLAGVVDQTSRALKGVTDATSAKNALPQLKDAVSQLDQMNNLAAQVPADGKRALNGIVAGGTPALQQLIDKVEAIPGVADVLKPTLDTLKAKLNTIGTQA